MECLTTQGLRYYRATSRLWWQLSRANPRLVGASHGYQQMTTNAKKQTPNWTSLALGSLVVMAMFACGVVVYAASTSTGVNWGEITDRALFAAAALSGLAAVCVAALTAFVAMAFLRAVQDTSQLSTRVAAVEEQMKNETDASDIAGEVVDRTSEVEIQT